MRYRVIDILTLICNSLYMAHIPQYVLDAEILLSEIMNITRSELILHYEEEFPEDLIDASRKMVTLRIKRIPISHILQKKEFFGLEFFINEHVIAPRPETELLVELAIKHFYQITHKRLSQEEISILDLGTGSGCIITSIIYSIKNSFPNINAIATDISKLALNIAKLNFEKYVNSNHRFIESDWFDSFKKTDANKFDIIVCNPPYVSLTEWYNLMPEVKNYEPIIAISDMSDGLVHYSKIIRQMRDFLKYNGLAIFECGYNQCDKICSIMIKHGFLIDGIYKDLAGIKRAIAVRSIC